MTYTTHGAQWANTEKTAAVLSTNEAGAVAISEVDTPEEWKGFLQWMSYGHPVEELPPPPPAPSAADKLDRFLARSGLTRAELKAALSI